VSSGVISPRSGSSISSLLFMSLAQARPSLHLQFPVGAFTLQAASISSLVV
jgi:hypothetical protein